MKRTHLLLLSLALILGAVACNRDAAPRVAAPTEPAPQAAVPAPTPVPTSGGMASGTVVETMDASSYTYVRVKTASGEIWAAGAKTTVAVGDKVVIPLEMPMVDFHSSTLNRTFPTIYFTARIFKEGEMPPAPAKQ